MCGIFGAVDTRGCFRAEMYSKFRRLTDTVDHRGPDDAGYLALDNLGAAEEGAPFRVFLGHRRLSILDLSPAGHQPMSDGHGNWIIFNGEIFNYVELRQELCARGHEFRTATDTEVILHLYSEYGPEGFNKLNGMWAFIIADTSKRRVIISRDRFSIKPLYMATSGSKMYFASEIKQLLPLLPSKQPNLSVMNAFLDQMLLDHTEETFFLGIRRIPANTNLIVGLDTQAVSYLKYWAWPEARSASSKGAVEKFRDLLLDSIRIRLRSDVKVGVLLSGGLDSSSIAVLANKLGCDLETYSVVSDDDCSEEKYVDEMVKALHCRNRKVIVEHTDAINLLRRVLYHNDEPVTGFSVLAQFQMFETIAKQTESTVLLSGQGADEILLGYLKFFFFYLRELTTKAKYLHAATEVLGSLIRGTVLHQFDTGVARRYMGGANQQRSFLRLTAKKVPIWQATDVQSRQKLDISNYSVPALTHYEDRNSMAFSLEVRNPFLDHRLVEFAVGLPTENKIHQGWAKHVLRQAVPELPDSIRWRKDKQGFVVPEGTWLKNSLCSVVHDLFHNSALEKMGVIDSTEFLNFYEQFRKGTPGAWHNEIARVLSAEMWARQFTSGSEAALEPNFHSEQVAAETKEASLL